MDNNKEISDSQIMKRILEELRYSALAFSKELDYKSHASIDHILKGRNQISDSLVDKVIMRFPEVNYWFMKKGQEPIILNDKLKRNQQNLFGKSIPLETPDYSLESFATLKNIEKILMNIETLLIKKSDL
jgi:hypothetical protein